MSRLFADILAEREVHPAFYCTIAGLPYVFADFDKPAHWALPSGVTWSRTLVPYQSREGSFESFLKAISEQIDWRSGGTISGNMDLQFLVDDDDPDDVWLNLISPVDRNIWYMDGERVHKPSDVVWAMHAITSVQGTQIQVGDVVHSGIGCAQVTNFREFTDGGSAWDMEINKFGSYFDWRGSVGLQRGSPRGGDIQVTSWPKVWDRRAVSLWMELCTRDHKGDRVVVSDSYKQMDGAGREIFVGQCATAPVWHPNEPVVTVLCQDITQPLSRTLITRTRKYRPGPAIRGMGSCYVEKSGPCLVEFNVRIRDYDTGINFTLDFTDSASTGIGYSLEGFRTGAEVIQAVETALNVFGSFDYRWQISPEFPSVADDSPDGAEVVRPKIRFGAVTVVGGVMRTMYGAVTLLTKTAFEPERSLLRALGAEDDVVLEGVLDSSEGTTGPDSWTYAYASNPVPHYYLAPANKRFYYDSLAVPNRFCHDPPLRQGTLDANGRPDGCYIRFGEHEIMEVQFREDSVDAPLLLDVSNGSSKPYMRIKRRAVLGVARPVVVPWDEIEDESHEIVLGLGFFNHDLGDVIKALLVSNGDPATGGPWDDAANAYNVLPQGFGAEMPAQNLHLASFELSRLNGSQPRIYSMWLEQALTARELLGEVALATGVNFLSRWDGARRKLGIIKMEPPSPTNPILLIDDSWVDDVESPVEPNYDEMGIRNRISFEYDYDPLEDKFMGSDNSFLDMNSIANYGTSDPVEIRVRWLGSIGDAAAQLSGIAAAIFRRFADPLVGYEFGFVRPEGWLAIPGDAVDFSKSRMINYRDGGLALVNVPMRVESISPDYGPEPSFGKMRLAWFENRAFLPWSPCIRLKAYLGSNTYSTYRPPEAGAFTPLEDGRTDLEFFQVGDLLVPYLPGEDEKGSTRTIISLDIGLGEIELDSTTGLSVDDGVVLEAPGFELAVAPQKNAVFLCDEDGVNVDIGDSIRTEGARWG